MRRQCAWCKETIGEPAVATTENREITHGICNECITNMDFQQGVDLYCFLDSLNTPLFVRGEDDNVQFVNRAAATLLDLDRSEFTPKKPGLVFECQYARLPEGCGNTIHCSGCAMRQAIKQTAATGQGVVRQPAKLKLEDREASLLITTEKVGDLILMRIDEITDN